MLCIKAAAKMLTSPVGATLFFMSVLLSPAILDFIAVLLFDFLDCSVSAIWEILHRINDVGTEQIGDWIGSTPLTCQVTAEFAALVTFAVAAVIRLQGTPVLGKQLLNEPAV
jgi:hypothetical protein